MKTFKAALKDVSILRLGLAVVCLTFVFCNKVFATPNNSGFPSCVVEAIPKDKSFDFYTQSKASLSTTLVGASWYAYHSVDSFDQPIHLIFKKNKKILLRNWRHSLPYELWGTYEIEGSKVFIKFNQSIKVGDGLGYLENHEDFVGILSPKGVLAISVRYPASPDKILQLNTFNDTLYKCKNKTWKTLWSEILRFW